MRTAEFTVATARADDRHATGPATSSCSIGGMTCASCAARIEKKLNKLDGVTATVNYATEKAKVTLRRRRHHRRPDRRRSRRPATPPRLPAAAGAPADAEPAEPTTRPRRCASGCWSRIVLTVPVIAMAMVPALQFTYWQWLSLTLAAPVVVWGGAGRSTGPRGPTCGTAPRPWTP